MLGCGAFKTCSSSLELSESESDPPAKNLDMFIQFDFSINQDKRLARIREKKNYEVNIDTWQIFHSIFKLNLREKYSSLAFFFMSLLENL